MAKATHYYNATTGEWKQLDILVEEYTSGHISNVFTTIKDSKDNMFVLCQITSINNYEKIPLLKFEPDGTKSKSLSRNASWAYTARINCNPVLSRDEKTLFFIGYDGADGVNLMSINVFGLESSYDIINILPNIGSYTANPTFAIYRDKYIWTTTGNDVRIFDYTTKSELGRSTIDLGSGGKLISASVSDYLTTQANLYITYQAETYQHEFYTTICKLSFVGNVLQPPVNLLTYPTNTISGWDVKQILIDKWGDLILLTNSGTNSRLLKYSNTGVQIGTAIDLGGAYFNLAIHPDGSLRYENSTATYKVPNTEGQPLPTKELSHILWRNTGNAGWGSNRTGYQPSVYC